MEATEDVEMLDKPSERTVIKRDGSKQVFDKEKINERIKSLTFDLNAEFITVDEIVEKVASGLYDGKFIF